MCPLEHVPDEKPAKKSSQPTGSVLTNQDAEFILKCADYMYLRGDEKRSIELCQLVRNAGRVEQ
jgi:hypothetical protein